jgi:type I restriction enzyme S subunit
LNTLIGTVPGGWSEIELGSICQISAGLPSAALPDSASYGAQPSTGWIPVVAARNLQAGRIDSTDLLAVSPANAQRLSRYRLAAGDVVCVRTGTLGRQALVRAEHDGWLFGTGCLRLRRGAQAVEAVTGDYLAYYLSHAEVRNWIYRKASSATVPSISAQMLAKLPVVLPPPEIQQAMCDVLGTLDAKIAIHREISHATTALRDSLLPGLLTGEIGA